MRRLISYLQFVLLFELNGSLTRVHLQGLILWALLEVVTSLWPRKVGLNGQSKIGLESWPGQRLRKILVKGGGIKVSS